VSYKQKTGYWLSVNRPGTEWQKDFYDHVIQSQKGLAVHVKYILDNPVRKQLVKNWEDYPYTGSIGCRLDDILNGMM
jgi:REP element-mobilizing transposase RayT